MANPNDELPALPGTGRAGWPTYVSIALALVAVAAALRDPDILGSKGTILDRLFGALLVVGAIGNALIGFHWRVSRPLRLIANPAFAWPAVVAGVAYGILA
ncbi:MAG: hypothetical protein IID55_00155 [Proteobacteria bacterium]|nr:hypothetical protein [Pseudomonadota bacterium]